MPDLFVAKKKTPGKKADAAVPAEGNVDTPIQKSLQSVGENLSHHMRAISAFSQFPDNIRFENQEEGEFIILFMRRHIVTNTGWIFLTILFALLPFLSSLLLFPVLEIVGISIPGNFLTVIMLFYYLLLFGYAYVHYVSWFFNIGIITNMRVVDIDVIDITSKNVAATEIEDLVDVEYNQQGFLQNFFDYGHLHVQVVGLKPNFEFLSIPHPAKAQDIISDLMREVKHD
jgi:hypothetical protein